MPDPFLQSEVVRIAIEIEKNGRDFYRTFAGQTGNDGLRELFTYLAGEEEKHLAYFTRFLELAQAYEPDDAGKKKGSDYLKTLARQFVFTDKDNVGTVAKMALSESDAIELAIKAEKDSILFYEEMMIAMPPRDEDIFRSIIAQEKEHLVKVSALKEGLNLKEGYKMAKSIKVYSTPTCPFCIRTKEFLKDNKIVFENIDVSMDDVRAKEMIAKSGQMGVPVLDIDGEIIVGFDKEKIKEVLGL